MPSRGKRARQSQPTNRRGWILLVALAIFLAPVAYWRVTSKRDQPANGEAIAELEMPVAAPPLPEPRSSPYLNTQPSAQYVGAVRCAECHDQQHATYLETAHAHSFAAVDPALEPPDSSFDHAPSRRKLRAYRAAGQLRHAESLALTNGGELQLHDKALKYLVGSGRFARTYLAEEQGFLIESPLTWYSSLKAWRMSPGYDTPRHSSFRRDVDAECLFCHVGRTEPAASGPSRLTFTELAIGCERCHGPGSLHVPQREANNSITAGEPDLSIVNPRRLSRELAEAICNQCHLESETSAIVRGRQREEFRPGLMWNDFVANYTYQQAGGGMTVTGHVEQMHASRCYQNSKTLTCTTCHDPHHSPPPRDLRNHYRAKCMVCHDEAACRASSSSRAQRRDDCSACHMPQSAVEVPHLAFTHHRIGIHPAKPAAEGNEKTPATALVPLLDTSRLPELDATRLLGLAYWRHHTEGDKSRLTQARQRAKELLGQVAQRGLYDPSVATALAGLALEENDSARAKVHAERALADPAITPRDRVQAAELVSAIYVQENRLADATKLLEQLIQQRPHPQYWFLLGICRQRQGDIAGAIQALERVVAIDPIEPATYRALANLHQLRGDSEAARRTLARAEVIEANLPK